MGGCMVLWVGWWMGLSFDILIFDCLLKAPQPITGLFFVYRNHFVVCASERNTVFYGQETLCCLCKRKKHCFLSTEITFLSVQKKETLFSMHKKHFVVCTKEWNTILYAQETLCCLCKRKKHCFLSTEITLFMSINSSFIKLVQMKETLASMHKKHFVVCAKERNTSLYAQETLCHLCKRKKHCFLCTRNILLSVQKKETLFSVHKKHFVVYAKERNTVFCPQKSLCCQCKRNTSLYGQETLYCLCKRKKHCFLSTRNTLLSMQMKETLFSIHKKHFLVYAKWKKDCFLCTEKKHCSLWMRNTFSFSFSTGNKVFLFHGQKRKQLQLLLFTALEIRIHDITSSQLFFSTMADEQDKETNHLFSKISIKSNNCLNFMYCSLEPILHTLVLYNLY